MIAQPPAGLSHTYAEFDLDLGNPLQDVAGFIVHMGELLDSKVTNHLDLLAKTKAADYLHYTVTTVTTPTTRATRRGRPRRPQ